MPSEEQASRQLAQEDIDKFRSTSVEVIGFIRSLGNLADAFVSRPTSIEQVFPLAYCLTKERIEDLFATVEQKFASSRTDGKRFELSIHYDDKTFEKFPTLKSFLDSHEAQPKRPISVRLHWEVRIYFEGRLDPTPQSIGEQQTIDVVFSTPPDEKDDYSRLFYIFNGQPIEGYGVVHVEVSHSNKIWAVEVIKHIEDFTKRIAIKRKPLASFFVKHRVVFGKSCDRLIRISPAIPLIVNLPRLYSSHIFDLRLVSLNATVALILFFLVTTFSSIVGRNVTKLLGRLQPQSAIITNEFSRNLYEQQDEKMGVVTRLILLVALPIALNIVSLWLSLRLGIE